MTGSMAERHYPAHILSIVFMRFGPGLAGAGIALAATVRANDLYMLTCNGKRRDAAK